MRAKDGEDYLRLELLLEPDHRLLSLYVDVEGAQYAFFARVHVREELQACHIDRDADPVEAFYIDILEMSTVHASDLLQVELEVGPELAHVELEVADLR